MLPSSQPKITHSQTTRRVALTAHLPPKVRKLSQRVTGMSPGRFLSAIRLQEAKRLLLSTSLNVADISLRVGYTSLGTFSTRFTRSVGLTPTAYRRLHGEAPQIRQMPTLPSSAGVLSGRVLQRDTDHGGLIYLGLFRVPFPRADRSAALSSTVSAPSGSTVRRQASGLSWPTPSPCRSRTASTSRACTTTASPAAPSARSPSATPPPSPTSACTFAR